MTGFDINASASLLPEDVPPSAWTGHLAFAFWIIEAMEPGLLVELGTHNGTSFLGLCQAIETRQCATKAYAVDTWEGDEHSGFYGEEVYEELAALVQSKYGGFAQLMRMRFDEAVPYFSDASVDLLHIDGLHTYEAVKQDFETWLPKMSRRGVVLFHDTMVRERGFGVWQLWEELRGRYPSFEFQHTYGLGVLLVGDQPVEALQALCALRGGEGEVPVLQLFDALGQRITYRERTAFLEHKHADAEKFRAHYQALFERAEAALAQVTAGEANARAELAQVATQLATLEGLHAGFHSDLRAARAKLGLPSDAALDAGDITRGLLNYVGDVWALHLGAEALKTNLDAANRAYAQLEATLHASENQQRQLEATLQDKQAQQRHLEATLHASETQQRQLDATLATREAELAMARADLRRRDALLLDAHSRIELRQNEVDRLVTSNSWRITAPIRWLRARLAAIKHGRPAPAYADMLGVPARMSNAPSLLLAAGVADTADAPSASAAPLRTTATDYLEDLFASDAARRAPEYLGPSVEPTPRTDSLRAKAIAFYLPQFHPFPENEAWWGKGFTEWTNVTKAVPQFLGHHQPQLPADLGFYDLRLPDVLRRQVEMAREYGLHGFAFHHYWFGGKRLMEAPLETYLAQDDIDFPFCLCWANENWTRRWDGHDSDILISQEHGPENDLAFIRDLESYLRDRRYIRVDGRPLLIIYRPSILPDPAATLRCWREHCREVGIGELFIAMAQFDTEDPREHGFDAAIEFPPHKLASGFDAINHTLDIVNPGYQGHVLHYQSIVDSAKAWPDKGFPLIRTVFPGWDNEARRPGRGYTFAFSTPERYKQWLDFAVGYAETNPVAGEKLVMINAWNEWAEGAHLEPDQRYGHAFLQATREVIERSSARPRIVLVSHDAHPHGAQYLTLHIARELNTAFGFDVDLVLLGGGRLTEEFARHATVHDATTIGDDPTALDQLAVKLRAGGATAAIVNTTVSGVFVAPLKRAGIRVVSLVHELPGLISSSKLESHAKAIALHSDKVVFAASQVRDGFAQFATVPDERALIRPQGLFTRSRYLGKTDLTEGRINLRRKLGIPQDSEIVLTVGYGDRRKGLDLLGEVASRLCPSRPRLHFVWVGHYEESLMDEVRKRVAAAGVLSNFHAVGLEFETDDFYAGADIYALTSREDPFPSVVLEALAVGLPVLAFSGTGGTEPLLKLGCGWLVDELSAAAYADRLMDLLDDERARMASANLGREIVARDFGFRRYVFDLLEMTESAPPKVSVIVPNYNYGELLHQRLATIARQSLPPYEIIVLDDCSSDASLQVLEGLRASLPMDIQVIPGKANSGSVFKQWLKGVERATGDFVWIAEADDLSDLDFLSTVVTAMHHDESVVISYCQSSAIGERGEILANDYLAYTNDLSADRWLSAYTATGQEEVDAGLAIKNTVPNVSAVIFRRKELLSTLRQHIEEISSCRVAGDWLTYLLLLEHGGIAYSPRVLNHHRRHSASVTSGSDQLCHLKEVMRAQTFARERFSIRPEQVERAGDYAQTLYEQFGLANDLAPRLEMNSQLRGMHTVNAATSKNEIHR